MPRKTIEIVVVDTSVFADYYFFRPGRQERHEKGESCPRQAV